MQGLQIILFLSFVICLNCNCDTNYTMCTIEQQYYCCPGSTCPTTSSSCIGYCPNVLCSDNNVQWCCNDGFQCDYTYLDHVCNQDCFTAGGSYCGDVKNFIFFIGNQFGCCFNNNECQSDGTCQATTKTFSTYSITFKQINWLFLYWQSTDGKKMKVCLSSSSSEVSYFSKFIIQNSNQNEDCIADFSTMDKATNYFKYFGKISDSYTSPKLTFHCDEMFSSCDFRYMIQTGEYNKLFGPDVKEE